MKNIHNNDKIKLADEYYQSIINYCYARLKNYELAVETANKVIAIFLEKWLPENNQNIKAWLMKTTNNIISELRREMLKKEKYEEPLENHDYHLFEKFELEYDDTKKRNDIIENIDINRIHHHIMTKLNEKEARLYKYLYIDRLNDQVVVQNLNLTKSAFKMRKTRLNKRIKLIVKSFLEDFDT